MDHLPPPPIQHPPTLCTPQWEDLYPCGRVQSSRMPPPSPKSLRSATGKRRPPAKAVVSKVPQGLPLSYGDRREALVSGHQCAFLSQCPGTQSRTLLRPPRLPFSKPWHLLISEMKEAEPDPCSLACNVSPAPLPGFRAKLQKARGSLRPIPKALQSGSKGKTPQQHDPGQLPQGCT